MKHRCSGLPRFIECPSSEMERKHRIDGSSEPSREGNAVHEVLALATRGKEFDVEEIAEKHKVNSTTIRVLTAYGMQAWQEIQEMIPGPARTEVKLTGDVCVGTADLLYADGEQIIIVDWKSGWLRTNALYQLTGYAHGAVCQYGMPKSGEITMIVPWLRFQEMETKTITKTHIDNFVELVRRQEKYIGKVWNPGEACTYCPVGHECEARRDYVLSAAGSMVKFNETTALTPQLLAELYPKAKLLTSALKVYDTALRAAVSELGELPLEGGKVLRFSESKQDRIDAKAAWPVLKSLGLSQDEIGDTVTMSKTKALDLVGSKVEKGKGKAKTEALKQLKEAGAVNQKTVRTLRATNK